jgi:HAMP domain-containing protein
MRKPDGHPIEGERPQPNRRRKYIIDPAFQWRYAATISAIVFLTSCVLGSILYGVLHQQARLRAMSPEAYTAEVTLVILLSSVAFATLTAGAVAVWSFVATHRICGPLFVMERYLRELTRGQLPELRPLRRKDEFNQLYSVFAEMVESLKARKRADVGALTEAFDRAKSAVGRSEKECNSTLLSLARQIESLRDAAAEALGDEPVVDTSSPPEAQPIHEREPVGIG